MSFKVITDPLGEAKDFIHENFSSMDIERLIKIKQIMELFTSSTLMTDAERIATHSGKALFDKFLVAGGVFQSIWHKAPVKDIDVYILDGGNISFYGSAFKPEDTSPSYKNVKATRPEYILDSRVSTVGFYSHLHSNDLIGEAGSAGRIPVNYIITSLKTRQELLEKFDMAHCQMSYMPSLLINDSGDYSSISPKVVFTMKTLDSIRKKTIVPTNSEIPIQSYRTDKLIKQGWKSPNAQYYIGSSFNNLTISGSGSGYTIAKPSITLTPTG